MAFSDTPQVNDQGRVLGETRQQLGDTRQELLDTQKALEENRRQLAVQTAALEDCRAELGRALEAQKTSEGVILGLKEEVERKSKEIEQLKLVIQERDAQMTILADENRARVEEVAKDAAERVIRIGDQARERMEADSAALVVARQRAEGLEAAARKAAEAELARQVEEERRARVAEAENVARREEAEVAAQMQVAGDYRMHGNVSARLSLQVSLLTAGL